MAAASTRSGGGPHEDPTVPRHGDPLSLSGRCRSWSEGRVRQPTYFRPARCCPVASGRHGWPIRLSFLIGQQPAGARVYRCTQDRKSRLEIQPVLEKPVQDLAPRAPVPGRDALVLHSRIACSCRWNEARRRANRGPSRRRVTGASYRRLDELGASRRGWSLVACSLPADAGQRYGEPRSTGTGDFPIPGGANSAVSQF